MRNISAKVSSERVIGVPASLAIQSFPKLVKILLKAMRAQSIHTLTPSQDRCIDELKEWLISIQDTDLFDNPASNLAYTYENVNTEEIHVFVAYYARGDYGIKPLWEVD